MLTVTAAWNQRGWSADDHQLDDSHLAGMVGRSYRNLDALRREAKRRAMSFPSVEYHDGCRRYRYDGSPQRIPGRHVQTVSDLGPVNEGT